MPFLPYLTLDANFGDIQQANADILIPFYGNNQHIGFLGLTGKTDTDSAWFASLGAGYRQMNGSAILGSYVSGDYNHTEHGNHFWTLNPGIEILTNRWNVHLSGYFPLGGRRVYSGSAIFSSDMGVASNVQFNQHTEIDAQIGYTFSS